MDARMVKVDGFETNGACKTGSVAHASMQSKNRRIYTFQQILPYPQEKQRQPSKDDHDDVHVGVGGGGSVRDKNRVRKA